MKEYFENNEENVQMSDLHHLYYMKKEKCADTTGDIMKKQNDTEDQEQPYLIERFDSYCKKVLQFEVMQYYHVKKISEKHIVLIDDVPQSISSLFCRYDEYPSLQNWFYVFDQDVEVKNSFLADALTMLTDEQQTIILAYYFLEMSDREIGERLQLTQKAVNRRRCKNRCRATTCTAICSHFNGGVPHFIKSAKTCGILYHAHNRVTTNMEGYQNGKLQGNPAAAA